MTKSQRYYLKHKKTCLLRTKKWKLEHPEKVKEQNKKDTKNFRLNHPDKILMYENKRRGVIINRLRKENGGKCSLCGYNKHIEILQFHHLRDKKFNISKKGKSYKEYKEESKKCVLLCPNCHAITHLK